MSADLILYTYPADPAVVTEATILRAVNCTFSGATGPAWTDNGDGTYTQTNPEWGDLVGMHADEYHRRMDALHGHLTGRVFVCEDYDHGPVPVFRAVLDLLPAPTRVTRHVIACVMVAMNQTVRPNGRRTVGKRQRVRRFLVAHLGEYVVAGVE